jgi:hypothetical protein
LPRQPKSAEVAASFTVTQNEFDGPPAPYDGTALATLKAYAVLPRCPAGTTVSLTNRCHDRTLLKQLRTADRAVSDESQIDAVIVEDVSWPHAKPSRRVAMPSPARITFRG